MTTPAQIPISQTHPPGVPYGWTGTIREFLKVNKAEWLQQLKDHHIRCMNEPAGESQIRAWNSTFLSLKEQFADIQISNPRIGRLGIVFEYELPRERGRRPDVIVLTDKLAFVFEFKDDSIIRPAYIDQATAYSRDLSQYHAESHHKKFYTLLVLTKASQFVVIRGDAFMISGHDISSVLVKLLPYESDPVIDMKKWLEADYAPLPSLVAAARHIFAHEPLPSIRRAQSAGIPNALKELHAIADRAEKEKERHLALVTGVPGAGKTLVGLQFVYSSHFGSATNRKALFLSGNGPLVKVLQHALDSTVFVQDVHGFLKRYGGVETRLPEEKIWVYDEAQRAWDSDRVLEKRGHGASEPEDFIRLGKRSNDWSMIIGLIGEGQEIHIGEEAGLSQWNDALKTVGGEWVVHCPDKISAIFTHASQVQALNALDLSISLRSHLASDLQVWVNQLLSGNQATAATLSVSVRNAGFELYVTRDLDLAKRYVRERYDGQVDMRFGILASSKDKILPNFGIHNEFNYTKRLREGPWYNDPPTSQFSCCQLHDIATEFSCQGLELDFPIVAWGDDLLWKEARWETRKAVRSKAHDPFRLRQNSYRVLLTRGRDGMIVFVPPDRNLDATFQMLADSGLQILPESIDIMRVA